MKRVLCLFMVVLLLLLLSVPALAYTPPADAVVWSVSLRWADSTSNIPLGQTVTIYNSRFNTSDDWIDYAGQELTFNRNGAEASEGALDTSSAAWYAVTGSDWAVIGTYENYWLASDPGYTVKIESYDISTHTLILAISGSGESNAPKEWDLAGGYYIVGDSALGSEMTFYIPADFAEGSLTLDKSGNLFNLTSSTIYLYCPDHPDYTITASRFGGFQYRTDSGYGSSYVYLNLHNITDTNVEIMEDNPGKLPDSRELLIAILCVLVIAVGAFVILRRF